MEDKKKWTWKALKKDQLLIILLVGVLLLIIAIPQGADKEKKEGAQSQTGSSTSEKSVSEDAYVSTMEAHLEEILCQMEGVGKVNVMITLKASSENVVEKDVETDNETVAETDSQGGSRNTQNAAHGETTVYEGGMEDSGTPYISKKISPQIEGVVVVAAGGNDAVIVRNITEAVQALFSIDTHKIKIMKKH